MKMSEATKSMANSYVLGIKTMCERELGIELSNKIFSPLRQKYEAHLHSIERSNRLMELEVGAHELGYTLTKIQK